MTNLFNIDLQRVVTAAVGALVLTTACVGAAIGPARAVEADRTIQSFQAQAVGEATA